MGSFEYVEHKKRRMPSQKMCSNELSWDVVGGGYLESSLSLVLANSLMSTCSTYMIGTVSYEWNNNGS